MKLLILFISGTLLAGMALGDNIVVANASFETLPDGGLPLGCGPGCTYSFQALIPGWSISGLDGFGQFQPGNQAGDLPCFNSLPDGITLFFSEGEEIYQTVGATVEEGITYSLNVDLGWRNGNNFVTADADAGLLVNGITYNLGGVAPAQGDWSTYTAVYTGLAADVGDEITIVLHNTRLIGDAYFDNVKLSSSSATTPEPSSQFLIVLGIASLPFAARWRSRTKR